MLSANQIEAAIDATSAIDADFEHASALKALLPHMEKATPAQIAAYMKSARGIDSSFELRGVLAAFAGYTLARKLA